jgi:hypothetical protein
LVGSTLTTSCPRSPADVGAEVRARIGDLSARAGATERWVAVVDLGTNVEPATFAEAIRKHGSSLLGLSVLSIPTFDVHGRPLIFFAGYEKHIGL